LAVSLPSLVAQDLLNYIVGVKQGRTKSMHRGLSAFLGFGPSLLGMAVLLGHFSIVASVLFVVLIVFWSLAIDVVVYLGYDPKSEA
jgi:hypothetical protein